MTGSSRTVFDQNAARAEFSGKLVTVNQQAIAEWAHDRPFPVGVILLRTRRAGQLENRDQRWYLPS
jgi:hypothetical protein